MSVTLVFAVIRAVSRVCVTLVASVGLWHRLARLIRDVCDIVSRVWDIASPYSEIKYKKTRSWNKEFGDCVFLSLISQCSTMIVTDLRRGFHASESAPALKPQPVAFLSSSCDIMIAAF
eukprot:1579202-Rhodomonas_salina.2